MDCGSGRMRSSSSKRVGSMRTAAPTSQWWEDDLDGVEQRRVGGVSLGNRSGLEVD